MDLVASHHVGLIVSNMERSLDFYCNRLGMRIKLQREITTPWVGAVNGIPGAHLKVAFLEAYGSTIELLEYVKPTVAAIPSVANRPGTAHLTFLVDDMDKAFKELSAQGVPFVSAPQTNTEGPNAGSRVVFILDPDNIRIELVQPAPGRRQAP